MRRSTRNSSVNDKKDDDQKINTSKRSAPKDTQPPNKKKTNTAKTKSPSPSPDKQTTKQTNNSKNKSKQKAKTVVTPASKDSAKEPAKDVQLKKVKAASGSVPVDEICEKYNKLALQVYVKAGKSYASTLNQSNVTANNNKFYIIQVLQQNGNPATCYFWSRWGRVGVQGQNMLQGPFSAEQAINLYEKKLRQKSVSGDYRVVQMNYEDDDKDDKNKKDTKVSKIVDEQAEKKQKKDDFQGSSLPDSVKKLIQLIFDMKMINQTMKQIGYDANKMPLGKLAKSSILKGYQALNKLMTEIKGANRANLINDYNNDFYSFIPHDFGFGKMHNYILKTEKQVKDKLQMLQSLEDIKVFTKLLDQGKVASDINELDSNYLKLNMNINPVDRKSSEFELVQRYITNTHAATHSSYKLILDDLFVLGRDSDDQKFTKDIKNKWLLWHGSRLTNYVGILSQGLRIAPPEAPVTGYMFGKGVYFADMVSKSANYCFTNPKNNTGLMILCQVALGDINEKFYADYYANLLPAGKSSTKGVGRTAPGSNEMVDDVTVPTGLPQPTNVANTSLLYNEYIVYDINQIRMKYLLRITFDYKNRIF